MRQREVSFIILISSIFNWLLNKGKLKKNTPKLQKFLKNPFSFNKYDFFMNLSCELLK